MRCIFWRTLAAVQSGRSRRPTPLTLVISNARPRSSSLLIVHHDCDRPLSARPPSPSSPLAVRISAKQVGSLFQAQWPPHRAHREFLGLFSPSLPLTAAAVKRSELQVCRLRLASGSPHNHSLL